MNRALLVAVRVKIEQAGLIGRYWDYAMEHIVHMKNCVDQSSITWSPYEKLIEELPTLKHVRLFGFFLFVNNNSSKPKVHATNQLKTLLSCNDNGD